MQHPAVSVVIPTYNRAELVGDAIRSVLAQTFRNFELIVVDDCSSDNTAEVVESIQDPRIRYVRNPRNRGLAGARNVGAREARARLIACLDDDDQWVPDKLQLQVERFSSSPLERLGAVYGGVVYDKGNGVEEYVRPRYRGDILGALLREDFYVVLGGYGSLMFTREAFDAVGGFDERLRNREDYDMHLRIALAGYQFDFVDAPVLRYRAHGDERMSVHPRKRARGFLQVLRKHKRLFLQTRNSRLFIDLMLVCRYLVHLGHAKLAWSVYKYAVSRARAPHLQWRYIREYLVIPSKIFGLRRPARARRR